MAIEQEQSTYYLECNNCGASWLGEKVPGDLTTKAKAVSFASSIGWRNDIKYGNGLLCKDCYYRRQTL